LKSTEYIQTCQPLINNFGLNVSPFPSEIYPVPRQNRNNAKSKGILKIRGEIFKRSSSPPYLGAFKYMDVAIPEIEVYFLGEFPICCR